MSKCKKLIEQLDGPEGANEAIEWAYLGGAARVVEPLLRRFQRSKTDRQQIVAAIRGLEAGQHLPRLLALISTLPGPERQENDFGQAAFEHGDAAQMLGRIGNAADIPLLIAVLKREVPGIPQPSSVYGDPARLGAVHALGRVGGDQAGQALIEQLNDATSNRCIMTDIVEEITRLRPAVPAWRTGPHKGHSVNFPC